MQATRTERPITYSRIQRLEGQIARLRGNIAAHEDSIRFSRAGLRYKRLDDCSEGEMNLALDALKRHPGTTFEECLAELRAK
jgi:hypothetical protein